MKSALTTISALVFGFFMLAACGNSEPPPDAGTDWTLVGEESRIAFVSVKAAEVAETHSFTGLTGSITTEGAATLAIDLNSVNTRIDIRDERMRELFFETSVFPTASLAAAVDLSSLSQLEIAEREPATIDFELNLHGVVADFTAEVFVTRIGLNRVLVETAQPVLLHTEDFDLGPGLRQLTEIASLPSISPAVPVTASLLFQRF